MKLLRHLEWRSPEEVIASSRKIPITHPLTDVEQFLLLALEDQRKNAVACAYDDLLRGALEGPVTLLQLGSSWKSIEGTLNAGIRWLSELLAINSKAFARENREQLNSLGVTDFEAYSAALTEQIACAIAVCENALYQMVDLEKAVIEEGALHRFQKNCDDLWSRSNAAMEKVEALGPRNPNYG